MTRGPEVAWVAIFTVMVLLTSTCFVLAVRGITQHNSLTAGLNIAAVVLCVVGAGFSILMLHHHQKGRP